MYLFRLALTSFLDLDYPFLDISSLEDVQIQCFIIATCLLTYLITDWLTDSLTHLQIKFHTVYEWHCKDELWGHDGRVVTLSPPTSEAWVWFPAWPQVGKLVVAWRWSSVYSTEPYQTVRAGFLCPSNYPSWYDLYSVESDVKPQINK